MVAVGAKEITARVARAEGSMRVNAAARQAIDTGSERKGSVLAVATVAAIQAAKRTAELIPLCHQLPLEEVAVEFAVDHSATAVSCTATVRTHARTGVEMEALTAVHVALLTVYDMCKAVDRGMEITSIRLVAKRGGKHDFGELTES